MLYTLLYFKTVFCAMLCVYASKLLASENEINYHVIAQD